MSTILPQDSWSVSTIASTFNMETDALYLINVHTDQFHLQNHSGEFHPPLELLCHYHVAGNYIAHLHDNKEINGQQPGEGMLPEDTLKDSEWDTFADYLTTRAISHTTSINVPKA
ncbi:hypothetical protein HK104_000267 [Borealophlyctis nickersoniae]|nr:hypothetical protein HK104_000267 [Borealophlyctis nickersoniae]